MTRTCLRQHLKAKLYVSSIKISDKKYVQLPKKYSSPISQLMQRSCLLTHSTSPRPTEAWLLGSHLSRTLVIRLAHSSTSTVTMNRGQNSTWSPLHKAV
uniref:Uncharacterized protein n=1 Tax=Anguilla anguilla TaxID=7936 RepID=A0A0E9QL85_ANGAN